MIRRSPLKRSAPPARRAAPRRVSALRDREYLDWLSLDCRCVACQRIGIRPGTQVFADHRLFRIIDPAHGPVNGGRSKGPDNEAVPLCRHHHDEQHRVGWPAFEAKYGFSREKEAKTHWAAFQLTKETV
jgi:hypothetical protein